MALCRKSMRLGLRRPALSDQAKENSRRNQDETNGDDAQRHQDDRYQAIIEE
jgi:hypothetical protein